MVEELLPRDDHASFAGERRSECGVQVVFGAVANDLREDVRGDLIEFALEDDVVAHGCLRPVGETI